MKSSRSQDWFTLYASIGVAAISLFSSTSTVQAQTFTILHSFSLNGNDGANPLSPLIRDKKGNLYGTAGGGTCCGVVFKVSASGRESILYAFKGYPDASEPESLAFADAGGADVMIGTTHGGGSSNFGTVFKLDNNGHETILYSFCSSPCADAFPADVLGNLLTGLYGVTYANSSCVPNGCGAVFKLNKNGVQTVLHQFGAAGDGDIPNSGLVRDSTGNIYGTTQFGGSYGWGTVFEVDTSGNEHVVYSFTGGADGAQPFAGLSLDSTGNLYGTTFMGGVSNLGTVFKVTPTGQYTPLYSFIGGANGANPNARVIRNEQGTLFGTTNAGGTYNLGTVFQLDTSGNEIVLHSFPGEKDSAYPFGLVADPEGNLYGTTYKGGAYNFGMVFKLVP